MKKKRIPISRKVARIIRLSSPSQKPALWIHVASHRIVQLIQNSYRRRKRGAVAVMLACLLFMGQASVWAGQYPVLCMIGEAENQGYIGLLAVAEAIRNRGTLRGVYGCQAKRVLEERFSEQTYQLAQQAWLDSAEEGDITNGATMWENVKAFGKPSWAYKMVETARIGDHVFYKEVKNARER